MIKKSRSLKSYEEVIKELIVKSQNSKSFFGFLGKNKDLPKILKEIQDERRSSAKF
jgi:predicted CopG family antitoxin